MKRIVFCFDGTWNKLQDAHPTNVVLIMQSVAHRDRNGTQQIVYYDEGVGTGSFDRLRGGIFGYGIAANLIEAYKFLCMNYALGDQIFVFGFSRGAFTARSFVGLVRLCGVVNRVRTRKMENIARRYFRRKPGGADADAFRELRMENCPELCTQGDELAWRLARSAAYRPDPEPHLMKIAYVGVWDTVGSLGIPDGWFGASFANRNLKFHDTRLSDFAASARHAVALDERRKSFNATLWDVDGLEALNAAAGFRSSSASAPFQQKWFPGDHGSVGGGGAVRGLSDGAFEWVLDGARAAGLAVDLSETSQIYKIAPDHRAPLQNSKPKPFPSLVDLATALTGSAARSPGPRRLSEMSTEAKLRWALGGAAQPFVGTRYRPAAARSVACALDQLATRLRRHGYGAGPPGAEYKGEAAQPAFAEYVVRPGDTLSKIAKREMGNIRFWRRLWRLNINAIPNPDRIHPGVVIRIPREQ